MSESIRTCPDSLTPDTLRPISPSVRIVAGWFVNFHNGLRTAENRYERAVRDPLFKPATDADPFLRPFELTPAERAALMALVSQHIQLNIRGRTTMDDTTMINFTGRDTLIDSLTDLLRKGARKLLQAAIEGERDAFFAEFSGRRTADGRTAVVGDGYHLVRAVQAGIGPVTVKVPKVWEGTANWSSAALRWCRPPCAKLKATECLMGDRGELLAFHDFPAQKW